jgi:predicted nucleotidyltransferase
MLTEEKIRSVVDRIVREARPSKVILFGSYARGNATENSDLDLMVIEPRVADSGREMVRLRMAIGSIGTGVDVLVYSEAEFERRSQVAGTVLHQAKTEGKVLYDAAA